MTSDLAEMTWEQRAEHYERAAERFKEAGNRRDAEFAEVNAKTMRLLAEEGAPHDD